MHSSDNWLDALALNGFSSLLVEYDMFNYSVGTEWL